MLVYQFYSVTHFDNTRWDREIVCYDDMEALLLAENMSHDCKAVEVWREARLVGSAPVSHVPKIP